MNYTAEQFTASNQANFRTLEVLATQMFSGFEKLVELNLAASKAALEESFGHTQAVMEVKDAPQLLALQTSLVQPMAEKSTSYSRHVYNIAVESGAELTKVFEGKFAEAQTSFTALVENMTKNAPAGSETVVAAFKSAVNAGQSAIESAQSSAKKAAELVESSFTDASNQVVNSATSVSKKR